MAARTGPAEANASVAEAAKFLTFSLAEENYAIDIARVEEIVGLMPVTRIPRLPSFIAGVVNLRGRVIPVVDLRRAFGMAASATTERNCIIVVSVVRDNGQTAVMGCIVDEVSDVASIVDDHIEETPDFGTEIDTSFIKGVARLEDRVVLLLDIDRVLSSKEFELVERAAVSSEAVKEESTQEELS